MPNSMMKLLPVLTAVVALGCLSTAIAETSNRSALAARQKIKNEVLTAMSDGKISKLERAEILAEAQQVLNPKELDGLKQTMNRLSPPAPKSVAETRRSNGTRPTPIVIDHQFEGTPTFLSRFLSEIPYIDDGTKVQAPSASKLTQSIPYMKTREADLSGAKQSFSKLSRLKETYLELPTAERPMPRIVQGSKVPAARRELPDSHSKSVKGTVAKESPRYVDESISSFPDEESVSASGGIAQPSAVLDEMESGSETSVARQTSSTLITPTGALLPERSIPSTGATYQRPMQPIEVEEEFAR